MRRFLFFTFVVFMCFGLTAQVKVSTNGQLKLGTQRDMGGVATPVTPFTIKATDSIVGNNNFEIENDGKVELKCDQDVTMHGVNVKSGGKLKISGENLTLSEGFEVELGGEFEFTPEIVKSR